MTLWAFIVGASALGGALVLWHTISRSKHASEVMLKQYSQMLAAARAEKIKKMVPTAGDEESGEPQEVS